MGTEGSTAVGKPPYGPALTAALFLAPFTTVLAVLQAMSSVFRARYLAWRLRRSRGHMIVVGAGPAAFVLAQRLAERRTRRRPIVLVGTDLTPAIARRHRFRVVAGDPTDWGHARRRRCVLLQHRGAGGRQTAGGRRRRPGPFRGRHRRRRVRRGRRRRAEAPSTARGHRATHRPPAARRVRPRARGHRHDLRVRHRPGRRAAHRPPFAFRDDDEVEKLAEMEHERWMRAKEAEHVTARQVGPITHADYRGWDDGLSGEAKDKDRGFVRNLPALLADEGLAIVRRPRTGA